MANVVHTLQDVEAMLPARLANDPDALMLIRNAWLFAERAHRGQQRRSGEPHTEHLYETAKKLAELAMGSETIAAGILHDTLEDTETSEADIRGGFGDSIAFLVAGVTKLKMTGNTEQFNAIETLRRLFSSAAHDPRILIIKLSDRLHNMHTLQYLPPRSRKRIAAETLQIYAPVADRLGMNLFKRELEDLSFLHFLPEEYARSERSFNERLAEREPAIKKAEIELAAHLAQKIPALARIQFHYKGRYSFFLKVQRKGGKVSSINDIVTLEVIVPTTADCYKTLGYVHALWRPVPGKFKDYISFPKPNGYQCLRTTVDAGELGIIEIQIYAERMHEQAQHGYAVELARMEQMAQLRASTRFVRILDAVWVWVSHGFHIKTSYTR